MTLWRWERQEEPETEKAQAVGTRNQEEEVQSEKSLYAQKGKRGTMKNV